MEEIFDWLREEIREKIEVTWEHDYMGGRKDAFFETIHMIDEVEAKWKQNMRYKELERRTKAVIPMLKEMQLYGVINLIGDLVEVAGIKISEE